MRPSPFHRVVDDLTSAGAVAAQSQAQYNSQNLATSHSAANGAPRITQFKRPREEHKMNWLYSDTFEIVTNSCDI